MIFIEPGSGLRPANTISCKHDGACRVFTTKNEYTAHYGHILALLIS